MAELIIQNPSITPNVFEFDEAGRVSAISGYPLAGEGGGEVVKSDLMWKPTVGNDGYVRWTLASSATTPDAAYISGAQGAKGADGKNGENGYSVTLQSVTDEDGGKKVTLAWGETPETSSFVIPSGAKGTDGQNGQNGKDGTSVIVKSIREFNDVVDTHTKGGTEVTLEWNEGQTVKTSAFSAFNGEKGQDGTGTTLTASSGINIDDNNINVKLGKNLKFDNYYNVTTEDDISGKSFAAVQTDSFYSIMNKYGVVNYLKTDDTETTVMLDNGGLNCTMLHGSERDISAIYNLNGLFLKSENTVGEYSGNYGQIEMSVFHQNEQPADKYKALITLTDYDGTATHTGDITVEKIAQWDQNGSVEHDNILSGNGTLASKLGIATTNMNSDRHYGFTTNGWSEIDSWLMNRFQFENGVSGLPDMSTCQMHIGLSGDYLPKSGGTVSGQLVVSGGSSFDNQNLQFIREGVQANGRVGIGSNGAFVIKHNNGAGQNTQLEFSTEYENGEYKNGSLILKAGNTEKSRVVNVTTSGYTNMNTFDPTNGPNYMLRKLPDGSFDIGAKVVNVTSLPGTTEANTYYFIYDAT